MRSEGRSKVKVTYSWVGDAKPKWDILLQFYHHASFSQRLTGFYLYSIRVETYDVHWKCVTPFLLTKEMKSSKEIAGLNLFGNWKNNFLPKSPRHVTKYISAQSSE